MLMPLTLQKRRFRVVDFYYPVITPLEHVSGFAFHVHIRGRIREVTYPKACHLIPIASGHRDGTI